MLTRYFYYFVYQGRLKGWKSEYIAQWTSGIVVLAFFSLNIFTIPIAIDVVFNAGILSGHLFDRGVLVPICFVGLVALLFLILNKLVFSKYLAIIKEFEALSQKAKTTNSVIIYVYMVISIGLYFVLGNYKIYKDREKDEQVNYRKTEVIDVKQDSIRKTQMDSAVNEYRKKGR